MKRDKPLPRKTSILLGGRCNSETKSRQRRIKKIGDYGCALLPTGSTELKSGRFGSTGVFNRTGLTQEIIDKFQLGYAPASWDYVSASAKLPASAKVLWAKRA